MTTANTIKPIRIPPILPDSIIDPSVISKNTSDNYECAKLNAQSLRYDAVFDTAPSTNSIVSIAASIQNPPKSICVSSIFSLDLNNPPRSGGKGSSSS